MTSGLPEKRRPLNETNWGEKHNISDLVRAWMIETSEFQSDFVILPLTCSKFPIDFPSAFLASCSTTTFSQFLYVTSPCHVRKIRPTSCLLAPKRKCWRHAPKSLWPWVFDTTSRERSPSMPWASYNCRVNISTVIWRDIEDCSNR